jgi:hypothetical protein
MSGVIFLRQPRYGKRRVFGAAQRSRSRDDAINQKRAVREFTTLSKFKGKVGQSAMTLYRIGDMLIAQYH